MNIYSTPAQVRELITIALKLGLESRGVRVQYSGGGWDILPTLPVVLPADATEGKLDIYSVQFTADPTNDVNVAATLAQIKNMAMPALYRAWYVWMQITGKVESIDTFTARLTEKVLAPELEAILGGK